MSSYDENGRGGNFAPLWAAVGVECTECFQNIDRCEGGTLYNLNGEHLCKQCATFALKNHKYATEDYCTVCKDEIKTTVLPYAGELLCIDCILERLDIINADEPANE